MQNTLQHQWKMEGFMTNRGRPTGIPWPASGGEKRMGAAGWPWAGLAQAGLSGEKTDSREAGIRISPLRILFFPGENEFISKGSGNQM